MTTKHSPKRHAFIAGSAHLDIMAVTEETDLEAHHPDVIAKTGSLHIAFGGCSHNMAINLAAQGVSSTLMTAINRSVISQLILEELRRNKVRLHVQYLSDTKEAGFCGQLKNGELVSAVTSTPVSSVDFSESFIRKGLKYARCVVMDCNLTVESMNRILALAGELDIPVFVAGVCEALSVKIAQLKGPVAFAFLNRLEMDFLTRHLQLADWQEVARKLGFSFVVTQDKNGATVCDPQAETAQFFALPDPIEHPKNTLGSGDLFLSSFVRCYVFEGDTVRQAVLKTFDVTRAVLLLDAANLGKVHLLEANMQEMFQKAYEDKLTGVLNRHGLEKFLLGAHFEKETMAALLIDADHFKKVNDTYGHTAGDEALVEISAILKRLTRTGDAVGRLGGEEFLCLLPDTTLAEAQDIAERMRQTIAGTAMTSAHIAVTASIGVGMWKEEETAALTPFVRHLDDALYQAKAAGRNKVVVAG